MSTFVLVHGAWHGAWAWYKVVPKLEEAGHDVVTIDLPAHGTDTTPVEEVTLESHVERVGDVLEAQDDPSILVGHSMAGVIITQTAEYYADEIDTLVYLTAFLPEHGNSLVDYSKSDEESVVTQNLVVDEDAGEARVPDSATREAFYGDCSEPDVELAQSLLRPEPLAGMVTPVETTPDEFGSVPRVYLRCDQDRAITPGAQREMLEALPCDEVHTLEASHSPFFSAPETVVEKLLTAV
ncbi:alpha/beta fold hydrolase [Halostagnicola sp. A-GB9-2]|uniref:alpha/beta fold hydrolase n=1 Tax=Halostagnicola sp. A-GB9-2 TaxID=3048066 RepID=UPI0024BFEA4D|nr:alpha/beta fold hydrolase [Halostagnicola sp. A-GB9-2]MDJ1432030.1 alpha/beta fold hydrolase [Halostagnicola sp. A-GB9-2]